MIEEQLLEPQNLTEEHFEIFQEEFRYWIMRYSLNNWEFHFYFEEDTNEFSARARLLNDHDSRIALIFLNQIWEGSEPTEEGIRQSAYHEVCELLLSKLKFLIEQRNYSDREVEEEIHVVIRTLENSHFYEDLKIRKPVET